MASFTDRINEGMDRLNTSPLGMAGLGLLLQPSMSREPINPWAYAAKGLEMGMQNRQLAAKQKSEEELQGMRRNEYARKIMQFNQEQQKAREEEARRARQEEAFNEVRSQVTDPMELALLSAMPEEAVKQFLKQRFPEQPSPTTLERNLGLAGLIKGTPEFQQAMMTAINRPPVQIGTTDKLLTASDLRSLRGPTGEPLPYGTTQQEAARIGASPILPPLPLTPEQQMQNKAQESKMQMGAKYEFARQTAAREVARLQKFMQNAGSFATLSPKDRAAYTTLADAAANAIAKVRGTPGAEPPKEAIESARASLPSLNDLLYQSAVGDVAGVKLRLLLEELGIGAESTPAMPPPNQGATGSGSSKARRGVLPSGHQYEVVED